jgi:hypothetical protein
LLKNTNLAVLNHILWVKYRSVARVEDSITKLGSELLTIANSHQVGFGARLKHVAHIRTIFSGHPIPDIPPKKNPFLTSEVPFGGVILVTEAHKDGVIVRFKHRPFMLQWLAHQHLLDLFG